MRAFTAGLVSALPFAPSIVALGAIFGTSTGPAGIGPGAAVLMSLLVFSGAGQFAALPLWPEGGPVIVLSTFALSLRFLLITTSLAPRLAGLPRPVRAALGYTVTDENYALAVARGHELEPGFLLGSWVPLYGAWVAGTVVGVLLGARLPQAWMGPIQAVFPLVFLVLTTLLCTKPSLALVALLGGLVSIAGTLVLPVGWNVVVAGLLASLVGPPAARLVDRRVDPRADRGRDGGADGGSGR
jgi:predicted branched-subunit amino acid permease